ncbi:MAG: hypothetical protein ACK5NF_01295 [Bacilli bacterium]
MILNIKQIEEIKDLIFKDKRCAIIKLVEYTNCCEYDARCLVEDYHFDSNFEGLLNKYWIESRENTISLSDEKIKFTNKEIRSLIKIFLPVLITLILVIILVVKYN